MKVFDENLNLIENPDLTKGRIEQTYRPITHSYKITQEEIGHYEVVKEYPNGGRDLAWVVDTPEEGHWITFDVNGKEIESNNAIPEDAPHEIVINDQEIIGIYRPYTEEEMEKMAQEENAETGLSIEERVAQNEADIAFVAMMADINLEG